MPPTPKVRDAAATRARLLQAATSEFATYGIAGARIERIGAAANANKALIYTYFGNKDQLFDAVMDAHVARILDQVPFTPDDLPGYAGRLFDFLVANPQQVRLATWLRLERGRTEREPEGLGASVRRKIDALAEAQAAKRVAAEFTAEDLLAFTLALATAWVPASPTAPADLTPDQLDTRRTAVVEAVRRLTS
ncbi:DNA-binding transcriptional regulator, AcrR family [Nonomuraea maritima]|uniref:DNA-binding transcriptional regulator, AcrR family n=1 Tax=Nonomuraea maritima TaxID=683260 RepID=A0A1G9JX11_9ACTN|nr:TetR/AcrR family transcriptional regulator [Nonomuraea maritima]SDL42038.1 DNA-binding transcriptional regulator, AcrR family [Nonomuraea maritima]